MAGNSNGRRRARSIAAAWRPWAVVIAVVLVGGLSYRMAMARMYPLLTMRIKLPVPLSFFPTAIEGWTGKDVPLSEATRKIAGNDDFVNRFYVEPVTGEWANMYIAYSGRPRTMVGHQPQVCYVNAGWISDGAKAEEIRLADGRIVPVLVHRFHLPPPKYGETVVLNYYVLNGVATSDETRFAGIGWRLPNISGNPARYVAQVQISSQSEAVVRKFAALSGTRVLEILPDASGKVKAQAGLYGSPAAGEAAAAPGN